MPRFQCNFSLIDCALVGYLMGGGSKIFIIEPFVCISRSILIKVESEALVDTGEFRA